MNVITGIVEDLDDPRKLGRVKVRLNGIHSQNKTLNLEDGEGVPTEVLPWATVIQDVTSAAQNKVGKSPTGIEVGSWVLVTATDATWNVCFVLGTLAGIDDVHETALGESNDIHDSKSNSLNRDEPPSSYAPVYPHNKTISTASGHLIEIDDTPGAERVHVHHKSGTFCEFNEDGSSVHKATGDKFSISLKNNNLYADGDINIITAGNAKIEAKGNCDITAENITATANSNADITASTINASSSGETSIEAGGPCSVKGVNVDVEASVSANIKGLNINVQAGALLGLSAGGPVTISGTVVAISGLTSLNI